MIPDILSRMTSIKARLLLVPLKFHKQLHVYIKRHRKSYVHILFLVLVTTVSCYPELTCLFYSVLVSQLAVKCLYVEVCLRD